MVIVASVAGRDDDAADQPADLRDAQGCEVVYFSAQLSRAEAELSTRGLHHGPDGKYDTPAEEVLRDLEETLTTSPQEWDKARHW